MRRKESSHGRHKSPKGDPRHSQLMQNQQHPFQPQYSSRKSNEGKPHGHSMRQKPAHANRNPNDKAIEMAMLNMSQQNGPFNNMFPSDDINRHTQNNVPTPMPAMPLPNMFQQGGPTQPPPPIPPQNVNPYPAPNPLNGPTQPFGLSPNPMNGPPSMPLAPNPLNGPPMQQSLNPAIAKASENFFQQLGGFNMYYYNALDPVLAQKKNIPIPQPASKHWPVLIGTIFLIAGFVVMAVGMGKFLQTSSAIGVAAGGVVVYLILTIGCSAIRGYIFNLKKFADYEALYNRLRAGRAYFVFSIECYHYETTTSRSKKGTTSTHRKKVVTHTARTEFNPTRVDDDSGQVQSLKAVTSYAFVKYLKRFYFIDAGSEGRFISAFNHFVSSNCRDTHQDYHYTFQIAGFEEEVGFSHTGEDQHSKVLFIVFTLLGLAYPYSMFFQNNVSRYEINILKKLTVH